MAKKQYEVIYLENEDLEKVLNEYAKKGFELVQVMEYSDDLDSRYKATLIFVK